MKLGALIEGFSYELLAGSLDVEVAAIHYDSRRVGPGSLFVAIPGRKFDGHAFIPDALERGAAALVVERGPAKGTPWPVPVVRMEDGRRALAHISSKFYQHPSRKIQVIGVTGTNGKTTTTYLLESILRCAGHRVGVVGTINYRLGSEVFPAERTTPEASDLQALLDLMVQKGARCAVIEVSSHSLSLRRVEGCEFDLAIFTNLSQDHLDFHGSLEDYFQAKARLFAGLGVDAFKTGPKYAVLNADDPWTKRVAKLTRAQMITYGLKDGADLTGVDLCLSLDGIRFTLRAQERSIPIVSPLVGKYNVYNIMAAAGAAIALGLSDQAIREGVCRMEQVPGRFEKVEAGQDFTVVVDYAHTSDALERVLRAARALSQGRLITVFGCGGDRDRTKRPLMGEVAARFSDYSILTSDNPRSEDPGQIIAEIEEGVKRVCPDGNRYVKIIERAKAIQEAMKMARSRDLVVIAGKGHEIYQIIGERAIPFDDRAVAREALSRLGYKGVDG